jgi:hypothetical protein
MVTAPLLQQLRACAESDAGHLPEWKLWKQEQAARQAADNRQIYNLQLEVRRKEQETRRAEYSGLLRTHRELAMTAAYATEPLEIALLQPGLAAHQAKLRTALGNGGQPPPHRLQRSSFIVETDQGRLRALCLDDIDFRNFYGDATALAAAFSAGAGASVTPEQIKLVLEDLHLIEHRTDDNVVTAFANRIANEAISRNQLRQGVEQLFQCMAEIDGDMRRERPALDTPLREGLRLAAAWANGPGKTGLQTTAGP